MPGEYSAQLVRLVSGDSRPHGTGFKAVSIDADFTGSYPAREQKIHNGSYAVLPDLPEMSQYGFGCWVYPTTPEGTHQTIASSGSFELKLEEGAFRVCVGPLVATCKEPAMTRRW